MVNIADKKPRVGDHDLGTIDKPQIVGHGGKSSGAAFLID